VFCPPVTTFKDHLNAKTDNIHEGVDLSVECDRAPGFARVTLEAVLGPPTVVVESGGEWMDPETGVIEPKIHLHWRLKTPTSTKEGHDLLKEARTLAARLVGGDGTNNSVVHPIRWPGSWHRKNTPRLAKIAAISDDSEIDLGEAVAVLREALGGAETGPHVSSDVRLASDESDVVSALVVIPNGDDPEVYHWTYWNNTGSRSGLDERLRSRKAGVSRLVVQIAEVRSGRDRQAVEALLHLAARQGRLRLAALSGPAGRPEVDPRRDPG